MIQAEGITKRYCTKDTTVLATDHVDLSFSRRGLYVILGKSGCGKTTLLNILSGLDVCDEGTVRVNGRDIEAYTENELDWYHNMETGVIFQEFNLISELSVYDNLKLVVEIQKWDGKNDAEIDALIADALMQVGLNGYEKRKISELSGGECQRIAIARALIKKPEIIFADEPTGSLDEKNGEKIFELLSWISREYTVIVVTHDRELAYRYGDVVLHIQNGRVVKTERPQKREIRYSFSYQTDSEPVREENDLSQRQLSAFLLGLMDRAPSEEGIRIFGIKREEITDSPCAEQKEAKQSKEKQTSRLSIKYRGRIAASFLKKKKITLVLTIVLLAVSTALTYAALTATFFDTDKPIVSYLQRYHTAMLPIYKEASYVDSFFETYGSTLTKGKYLSQTVSSSVEENVMKIEADYDGEFMVMCDGEWADSGVFGVTTFFVPDEFSGYTLAEGTNPKTDEEVVITDYLAEECGVSVGDVLSNRYGQLKICGIAETDYVSYNLKAKRLFGTNSNYLDYYLKYRYCVLYCRQNLLHGTYKDAEGKLLLPQSDFTYFGRERSYRESEVYYDTSKKITEEMLVAGRMPKADNEILVSLPFAESRGLYDASGIFEEREGFFEDIEQDSFQNAFSMNLNMKTFYPQGARVVGVVSNFEWENNDSDVYVADEVWKQIRESYYDYYKASVLYYVEDDELASFISDLSQNGIRVEEPAVTKMYLFSDVLQNIRPFLFALLLLAQILNGFMIINFIQISVRSNRRNIGVLRSLGVTAKDVERLLSVESLVVYGCSSLLSVPIILIMQNIANSVYLKNITENPFPIVLWNWKGILLVLTVQGLLSILALRIPMKQVKKPPKELLR